MVMLPITLAPAPSSTPRADLRMAVAALGARAAQRHALQHGDVVADHRCLADDDAGAVVDEDALADARGRIDVDLEHLGHAALQVEGQRLAALVPHAKCATRWVCSAWKPLKNRKGCI